MPVDEEQLDYEVELEEEELEEDIHEEEKVDPRTLITHDQLVQLQGIWSHYDPEKRDRMPVKMIGFILRMMGHNPTKRAIREMVEEIDPTRKGFMDFSSFLIPMALQINDLPETPEDIIAAFKVFDTENLGYVYNDILTENLSTLAEDLDDVELEIFFKMADPKNLGKVHYVEFVEKIMGVVRKTGKREKGDKKKGGKGKGKGKKKKDAEGEGEAKEKEEGKGKDKDKTKEKENK